MKFWPWQRALDTHKREDDRVKEEVKRRLALLDSNVKVLRARVALEEGRRNQR